MSENEIKPVARFCPECGHDEYESGDSDSKFCSHCGQEWFSDVNYSDAIQENLKRLSSVVLAATNERMPHVGARELQSAIDRLTAERDDALAAVSSKAGWEWKKRAEQAEAERDAAVADRGRYFCDGPDGHFFCDDLELARGLVNAYDKDNDWTITDMLNPCGVVK